MDKVKKELVIITGMSGAGKSEAMKFFEDREYFCIDNFPINLYNKTKFPFYFPLPYEIFQYDNPFFVKDHRKVYSQK